MKQLTCEMCGSTDMMKQNGVFVCQTCGTKYSVEEAKKLMIEGVVEVAGTVNVDRKEELDNILLRIKDFLESEKWADAKTYCEKALDIDSRCPEAYLYRYMSKYKIKNTEYVYVTSFCVKDEFMDSDGIYPIKEDLCYEDFEACKSEETKDLFRFFELTKDKEYVEKVKSRLVSDQFIIEDTSITKIASGIYYSLIPDFIEWVDGDWDYVNDNKVYISKKNKHLWCDENGVVLQRFDDGEVRLLSALDKSLKIYRTPDNVTEIMGGAFNWCNRLETVILNDGLKTIHSNAFDGCENLQKIIIPNSVEEIYENAFRSCHKLKYVKVSESTFVFDRAFVYETFVVITDSKRDVVDDIINGIILINEKKKADAIKVFEKIIHDYPEERVGYLGKAVAVFDETQDEQGDVTELLIKAKNSEVSEDLELITREILSKKWKIIEYFCKVYNYEMVESLIDMGSRPVCECMVVASKRPPKEHIEAARRIAKLLLDEGVKIETKWTSWYTTATDPEIEKMILEEYPNAKKVQATEEKESTATSSGGCYVATAVYGSYDCPQVWTLRRYRDNTLASTWYGRAFIHTYYAISPTLVKWFGHTEWFKKMWQGKLDRMVEKLQSEGVESTPYEDKNW